MSDLHVLPQDREACICSLVRTLARKTTAIYEADLRSVGLKLPQYGMLARLDRLRTGSLSDLAAAMELDLTSTSRSVATLVRAGLVEVSEGPDGRTKSYRLSRDGKRTLKKAYGLWQKSQAKLKGIFSAAQCRELIELTDAVSRGLASDD